MMISEADRKTLSEYDKVHLKRPFHDDEWRHIKKIIKDNSLSKKEVDEIMVNSHLNI